MELKGVLNHQFQGVSVVPISSVGVKGAVRITCSSYPSHFRELYPVSHHRRKIFETYCNDGLQNVHQSSCSKSNNFRMHGLTFDRLQPSDQEYCEAPKLGFGQFVARAAVLNEEYWVRSCFLRPFSHQFFSCMHADSYKRKYAEQEYYALKRRCSSRERNSLECVCIVTVKKEDKNVRRTVLNSIVGTLDLSIRQFLQGETFPGELKSFYTVLASHGPNDAHKYAYIANVCVPKFARRQGIASNMLYFATDLAISSDMKLLFVHVNAENKSAQELYRKTGFQVVEATSSPLSNDQRFLMCMKL
ncbi:hypothetical protein GIB67_024718 [Kingdonia uniflora]|uniref:N-acetyltransferase domain-containing protein n=1 Tax=Kingdonia uniflora TaxID=39325 RepID=A0A7J7N9U6_9MAGN|nr:hypothetical protein GIB67_024718 [Kingdonia uniflora]